jgi:ATP-dependent Clp protease adaptor protein ClpS
VGLWEKPKASITAEVTAALTRAHVDATVRRHTEVLPLHVLCALLEAPSVETCLAAMNVEPAAARKALGRALSALPRVGWLSFAAPTASEAYEKSLASALAEAFVSALAKLGFTRLDFLKVVAHGDTTPPPPPLEGLVSVVLRDDPFSTMELVVGTLRDVFGMANEAEARALMMRVHRSGSAIVGSMDAAIARTKIDEVHARAEAAGMPLRATAALAS